jgi:hypothetical protein
MRRPVPKPKASQTHSPPHSTYPNSIIAAACCNSSSVLPQAQDLSVGVEPNKRSQHIVSMESVTSMFSPVAASYTVDRGESALLFIRNWLRSAFCVGPPQPPVSGVAASPVVNRRILASFRHLRKAASVGPRLPSAQLLSRSRMPPSVGILVVLHGEVLYFQHRQYYFGPPTIRVTHLAKKTLPMRHPISPHHLNSLKKRSLKPHE